MQIIDSRPLMSVLVVKVVIQTCSVVLQLGRNLQQTAKYSIPELRQLPNDEERDPMPCVLVGDSSHMTKKGTLCLVFWLEAAPK